MRTFLGDLRYGARPLLQHPGFSVVAVTALAVGIGANLTIFGLANALLLRPPSGVADPGRVGSRLHESLLEHTALRLRGVPRSQPFVRCPWPRSGRNRPARAPAARRNN